MEDMGSVAEWDEEFQINLKSRLKKCASDSERDEVIGLGTTWVSKGDVVRRYCEQFTRCIVRRDYEEEAAMRRDQRRAAANKKKAEEEKAQPAAGGDVGETGEAEREEADGGGGGSGGGDDVWRDTLQMQFNDQHNWKERDSGCARRLMVKMLAKCPPIMPPYIALPFDAWKVAKEYVDSLYPFPPRAVCRACVVRVVRVVRVVCRVSCVVRTARVCRRVSCAHVCSMECWSWS
jgi:hypothetical protein